MTEPTNPTPAASDPSDTDAPIPSFTPVPVRQRHDGWTPDKQERFIEALGECGCVADACRRVGMTQESAYGLRRRVDAQSFRLAWDAALDFSIRRLSDAAFSRAIHGVAVPHYYKGELVGEHRRYDERLTQFLLRYRDPLRYARSRDRLFYEGHDEMFAVLLAKALDRLADDAWREAQGLPPLRADEYARQKAEDGEEEDEEEEFDVDAYLARHRG